MQRQLKRTDRSHEEQQTEEVRTKASATETDHTTTDALLDEIDRVLDEATVDEVEAARRAYREKLESLTIGRRSKSGCDGSGSCTLCTRSC